MTQSPTPIHEVVREHYAERIKSNTSCCGPSSSNCCSTDSNLYPADLLASMPNDLIDPTFHSVFILEAIDVSMDFDKYFLKNIFSGIRILDPFQNKGTEFVTECFPYFLCRWR